ncbi:unnamed protein product [Sphagnum jensenii]|uniref:Glycosyltransferase N-terminal domain-containing protein n=1 Tax=Sphagnum jensenii TaxID=128206 RepID=A0ABP1BFI7_9BRYO
MGARGGAHVVAFPFPAKGHILPMVQLSKSLANHGIAITFVIATPHLASARALVEESFEDQGQIQFVCFEIPPQFVDANFHNFLDLMRYLKQDKQEEFAGIIQQLMAPDVIASNQPSFPISHSSSGSVGSFRFSPPVCIISDMLLNWTQDTSDAFKIPRYCLYTCPARGLSLSWHGIDWLNQGLVPFPPDAQERLEIPGFPPFLPIDLPEGFKQGTANTKFHVQQLFANFEKLKEANMVLVNTVYELESGIIAGLQKFHRILTVGPLLLSHNDKSLFKVDAKENNCLQFLIQQPRSSVLYICFGTIFTLPTKQLNELAVGLEASGVRFLWVIKTPKDEDGNLAPDITTFLPEGFMERTKDRGLVYTSWAPQIQILAHPAVGGFLTHCGWNSIMESISMGVSMIAWPLWADQMLNARFCVDVLNIAIAVDKKEIVGPEEVERVVRLLMEDGTNEIVRKNVKELSKVVGQGIEPGGSSRKNLDLLVEELNSMNLLKQ